MSMTQYLEALTGGMRTPDESEGRIYGVLYGVITDVDQKLGRVKARIGAQQDHESTDWIDQAWPGCIEAWPNKGDSCYVAFVDGDPNRGVCLGWHPTTKTKGRAQDAVALGTTLVGLINYFVDQFNQFRNDFNSHTHSVPASGISAPVGGGPCTGSATAATPTATAAFAANKGKASDGSVVSNQTQSVVVLSGHVKVNK